MSDSKAYNLHLARISVNCWGAWILLSEAKIAHNLVDVDLMKGEQMKPAFLKLNPTHTVPTLEDGSISVFESNAILRYIVRANKLEDPWYPTDTAARVRTDIALEWRQTTYYKNLGSCCYPALGFSQTPTTKDDMAKMANDMKFLEEFFLDGRKFIGGDKPSIADLNIVPPLYFTDVIDGYELPSAIKAYRERFAAACPSIVKISESLTGYIGYLKSQKTSATTDSKGKKALIVTTSATSMNGHPTGAWSEEITGPYYVFADAGLTVDIASVAGGEVPIDAGSLADGMKTENDTRFMADETASGKIKTSLKLTKELTESYDIVFFAGGHGTCVDFADVGSIFASAYEAGKVTGAVCHGPTVLEKAVLSNGDPVIKGKNVTGFSNVEEKQVGLADKVPFLLEDKLKQLGGIYTSKDPWSSHAVADGKLVTGQNPQSSVEAAKLCIAAL